jgi:3'-phosphoadenosine 5'-phosphosulfate sulfotransferase (PAPS reductase)/FAD synthetase
MSGSVFGDISKRLTAMYLEDDRPWLIGFSGGKDSTLVTSLVFDAVLAVAPERRTKEIAVLCTDTRVEIPAIAGMIESTLGRMRRYSIEQNLNIEVNLLRHPRLPRVWVSNPIEHLSTEEVWAYLLQHRNPWGGDNRPLYKLYASASNGECPIQIDTSTPACGNSRFGCWTCTVVERDLASEGLLASGDERMEGLLAFRTN